MSFEKALLLALSEYEDVLKSGKPDGKLLGEALARNIQAKNVTFTERTSGGPIKGGYSFPMPAKSVSYVAAPGLFYFAKNTETPLYVWNEQFREVFSYEPRGGGMLFPPGRNGYVKFSFVHADDDKSVKNIKMEFYPLIPVPPILGIENPDFGNWMRVKNTITCENVSESGCLMAIHDEGKAYFSPAGSNVNTLKFNLDKVDEIDGGEFYVSRRHSLKDMLEMGSLDSFFCHVGYKGLDYLTG